MLKEIIVTLISILVLYLAVVFLVPFLVLPNHLIKFGIQKTPKIKKTAERLKAKSKEQTLKNVYRYITTTYEGEKKRYKLFYLQKLFLRDIEKLLDKKQFLACHIQNLVLITLLINTGQFEKKDIKRKTQMTFFGTVHQYVIIKINKIKYQVDPFFKIFRKI